MSFPRDLRTVLDHAHEPHGSLAPRFRRERENQESVELLWLAVIEQAHADLEWLRDNAGRDRLKPHEEARLGEILEQDPKQFLEGSWFRTICDGLGLEPDRVWRLLGLTDLGLRRKEPAGSRPPKTSSDPH